MGSLSGFIVNKANSSILYRGVNKGLFVPFFGPQEPGITDWGISESGKTESGIIFEIGNEYNGTWYNGIRHNKKVESDIMETGITELGITWISDYGMRYNKKLELVNVLN